MYRMIIMENHEDLRRSLCDFVAWRQLGFELCGDYGDGWQALGRIERGDIDVILSDISMPGMDGLELARRAKEIEPPPTIVLLSAYKDFEYARKALSLGVKAYIIKPATYDDFSTTFTELKAELDKKNLLFQTEDTPPEEYEGYHPKLIAMANRYIHDHCREATLEKVAEYLRMNPSYFSRLYKQISGVNFQDCLTRVRMEKALTLLDDARLRTRQISELLGYSSPHSFARAFRKYYGRSPSEYRNRNSPKDGGE